MSCMSKWSPVGANARMYNGMYVIEMKQLLLTILMMLMCVTHAEGDNTTHHMAMMQMEHKTENYM